MYRFALRPRWLLSHLFALSLVVAFLNLGFWQLRRHDERAARNAAVESQASLDPVSIESLDLGEPERLRFRPARVTGTLGDQVILVDNRSLDGMPGVWVLQPLTTDSGAVVVVGRGFVAYVGGEIDLPPTPAGPVEILGTLVPWDVRDCGTRPGGDGVVAGMACLRRDTVEQALDTEVLPVVLQRVDSTPTEPPSIVPVPRPELNAGPHRSYAAQWFIFATIGTVGYALILRRIARDRPIEPVTDVTPETAGR